MTIITIFLIIVLIIIFRSSTKRAIRTANRTVDQLDRVIRTNIAESNNDLKVRLLEVAKNDPAPDKTVDELLKALEDNNN